MNLTALNCEELLLCLLMCDFCALLNVHRSVLFVNKPTSAQIFMCVYFYSLHVSGNYVSIIRRINCISAIPGTCHCVWTTVWYAGWNRHTRRHVYFYSLHVSGKYVSNIRRINCISAIPGICHSVWSTVWSSTQIDIYLVSH